MKAFLRDNYRESWRKYGRDDPYFGVLTEERYRTVNLDDSARAAFFQTGEEHIARVLQVIGERQGGVPSWGRALDFGCGVGRLLLPMARRFNAVSGVDISPDYLAETTANAGKASLSNFDLFTSLDDLADRAGSYDFVHSCIVFNHIPLRDGKVLLGQLADLTRDGGIMAVQMLHRRHASLLRRFYTWGRYRCAPVNWLSNWMRGRPFFEPVMQANEYPLDAVLPFLEEKGARDFYLEFTRAFDDSYVFLFCRIRRPGS